MRATRLLLGLGVFIVTICSYPATAQGRPDAAPAFDLKEHYTKYEAYIPMRDGKKLFTSIYVPKDTSHPYPFLMTRTPYSVSPYGVDHREPPSLPFNSSGKGICRTLTSSCISVGPARFGWYKFPYFKLNGNAEF